MVPAEVLRDLSVIAELVNATKSEAGGLTRDRIARIRDRYGMTYARNISPADRDRIGQMALRFEAIFGASRAELAAFANRELANLSFSPRIWDHGEGYGWHIHFFGEDFDLTDRIRSAGAMSVMSLIIHAEGHRLKRCAASDCQKVFIDTTRNIGKIYCDPRTCGNRTHVAAFRTRA